MAVRKERDPQLIDFLRNDDTSRCQLQERRGRAHAIGDPIKVVITETRTERRRDGLDRIAEPEFREVDRTTNDRQQVHQATDDGSELWAKIGEPRGQFAKSGLFVTRINDDRTVKRTKSVYQCFSEPAPWVAVAVREEFPMMEKVVVRSRMQRPLERNGLIRPRAFVKRDRRHH